MAVLLSTALTLDLISENFSGDMIFSRGQYATEHGSMVNGPVLQELYSNSAAAESVESVFRSSRVLRDGSISYIVADTIYDLSIEKKKRQKGKST